MSSRVADLKTYAGFARRFGRRFLEDRLAERRTPIAPAPHKPFPSAWSDECLTVAWLGHASVLINIYGTWLLTDPALSRRVGVRVGPAMTLGPRRLVEPALATHELPQLDAVLLSHAHMDHSDLATLRRLPRATRAVVQRGNLDLVRRFRRADELAWGASVELAGARIESIEVNHWGARKLTDRGRGYGGFLIEKRGRAVVFGGDTAYTRAFARLRRPDLEIVLAILPIGAYNPYVYAHANPEQSWAMSREMGARYILPIHHSTFKLSREPVNEPITRMLAAAGDQRWRVAITQVGQTWTLPERSDVRDSGRNSKV